MIPYPVAHLKKDFIMRKVILALSGFFFCIAVLFFGSIVFSTKNSMHDENIISLNLYVVNYYGEIPGLERVEEEINRRLKTTCSVKVNMTLLTSETYDATVQRSVAANQPVDIIFLKDGSFIEMSKKGYLTEISDLLEANAPDICKLFSNEYQYLLDAAWEYGNGHLYGIPSLDNKLARNVVCFRSDILKECQLSLDSVESYQDLTPLFEIVHEKYPSMRCLERPNQTFALLKNISFNGIDGYNGLGDGIGVLIGDDNWDVINLYDTKEYEDFVGTMHLWYEKGYIAPDAATSADRYDYTYPNGDAFSFMCNTNLTVEQFARERAWLSGYPSTACSIGESSIPFLRFLTCIPSSSQHPELALQVLNEIYSDSELLNLLYYGVEGVDYVLDENGLVSVEGITDYYRSMLPTVTGNRLISGNRTYEGTDYQSEIIKNMANAETIPTLTFIFDPSSVGDSYQAVLDVIDIYATALEFGCVDPDIYLPVFREKLREAGIDEVIAEKQRQLSVWRKRQKGEHR